MTPRKLVRCLALLFPALLSAPVAAGQLYDMGPMLDAPHPFDVPAAPQLRRPRTPGYSGRLYDMGPMLDAPHPFDVPAQQQPVIPTPLPRPKTVPLPPPAS